MYIKSEENGKFHFHTLKSLIFNSIQTRELKVQTYTHTYPHYSQCRRDHECGKGQQQNIQASKGEKRQVQHQNYAVFHRRLYL